MTMPTPDAQSARFLFQEPNSTPPISHSMPPVTPYPFHLPSTPPTHIAPPSNPATESLNMNTRERVIDFADHSWNLATGGLKTLTAKREIPPSLERRMTAPEKQLESEVAARNYAFAVIVLACIVVMLISGGIVLSMMLQP
ncbi:MAG TPA: hypothetical protein VF043_03215 [Ktedonobacteraceae bacterium]